MQLAAVVRAASHVLRHHARHARRVRHARHEPRLALVDRFLRAQRRCYCLYDLLAQVVRLASGGGAWVYGQNVAPSVQGFSNPAHISV